MTARQSARLTFVTAITGALGCLLWAAWLDHRIQSAGRAFALTEGGAIATAVDHLVRLQDERDLMLRLAVLVPLALFALHAAIRWALRSPSASPSTTAPSGHAPPDSWSRSP